MDHLNFQWNWAEFISCTSTLLGIVRYCLFLGYSMKNCWADWYFELVQNARPEIPDHCPLPLRHLMQQCWMSNPESRPFWFQNVRTLEDFKLSLSSPDFKLDRSAWHGPSENSNMCLRCFQGFPQKSMVLYIVNFNFCTKTNGFKHQHKPSSLWWIW